MEFEDELSNPLMSDPQSSRNVSAVYRPIQQGQQTLGAGH
jgi:hypothetical protein